MDLSSTPDAPFIGKWVLTGKAATTLDITGDGSATLATKSAEKSTSMQGRFKGGELTLPDGIEEVTVYAAKIRGEKLMLSGGRLKKDQEINFQKATAAANSDQPQREARKYEQPKLPKSYGEMAWDYTALAEHYDFIDVGVNEKTNRLVFTLKLKKDQTDEVACSAVFYDADGVKINTTLLYIRPIKAFKRGDVIEASVENLPFTPVNKDVWGKAVKVTFSFD